MTNPVTSRRETETLLKTMEAAASVLAAVAVLTLVIGGWIGIRTVTYTIELPLDTEHPRQGLGIAVLVLSLAVTLIAACGSWVLFTYVRPRLIELRKQTELERERLAQEGW